MRNSNFGLDNNYVNSFPTQRGILNYSLAVIMQEVEVTTRNFTEIKEAGFKMNLNTEKYIIH